jgi:hypothetical protein
LRASSKRRGHSYASTRVAGVATVPLGPGNPQLEKMAVCALCLIEAAANSREPGVNLEGVHGLQWYEGSEDMHSDRRVTRKHSEQKPQAANKTVRGMLRLRVNQSSVKADDVRGTSVMWKDTGESSRSAHWLKVRSCLTSVESGPPCRDRKESISASQSQRVPAFRHSSRYQDNLLFKSHHCFRFTSIDNCEPRRSSHRRGCSSSRCPRRCSCSTRQRPKARVLQRVTDKRS